MLNLVVPEDQGSATVPLDVVQTVAAQNGTVHGTIVESNDSKAATAEAEMSQSAGDVGDWLGVDSGGPAPIQVTLVLGMPYPGLLPSAHLAMCKLVDAAVVRTTECVLAFSDAPQNLHIVDMK